MSNDSKIKDPCWNYIFEFPASLVSNINNHENGKVYFEFLECLFLFRLPKNSSDSDDNNNSNDINYNSNSWYLMEHVTFDDIIAAIQRYVEAFFVSLLILCSSFIVSILVFFRLL